MTYKPSFRKYKALKVKKPKRNIRATDKRGQVTIKGKSISITEVEKLHQNKKVRKPKTIYRNRTRSDEHRHYPLNIVVVAYNELEYTMKCVESIRKNTKGSYALYLVDNGSDDKTYKYFRTVKNANIIRIDKNRGYAYGCNEALRKIFRGDVIILNSNIIVPKNWTTHLLNVLNSNENIGMVGPVSNDIKGAQNINVDINCSPQEINKLSDKIQMSAGTAKIKVDNICGHCVVIRGDVFKQIGLFDPVFVCDTFGNNDYCKRVKLMGKEIVISKGSFVYHCTNESPISIDEKEYTKRFEFNTGLTQKKWNNKGVDLDSTLILDMDEYEDLVSIITPCFNSHNFIEACVNSVLTQTHKNIEMIIVDDGSNAETKRKLKMCVDKSERIKLITNPINKGRSFSRNRAIENAKGKYILPLDSDDLIHRQCVAILVKHMKENDDAKICYPLTKEFGNCNKIWFYPYRKDLLVQQNLLPCTSMFLKDAWINCGGYDIRVDGYEDWDFWLRMYDSNTRAIGVPEPIFFYRKHNTNSANGIDRKHGHDIVTKIKSFHPKLFG